MTKQTSAQTQHWQALSREHHLAPFTDYKQLNEKGARIITKAEGVYLWDSEGNKILDGMAGLWCMNVGYGRKELAEVLPQLVDESRHGLRRHPQQQTPTGPREQHAAARRVTHVHLSRSPHESRVRHQCFRAPHRG